MGNGRIKFNAATRTEAAIEAVATDLIKPYRLAL
jgi:hypothetical protein